MLTSTKSMPDVRDCPLCGGTMRLKQTQQIIHVPGHPQETKRSTAEWICPECDYFEEAEGD
jgi:ssDNA-binding Zn-finger/Zn-ribbon topoisomerase 1